MSIIRAETMEEYLARGGKITVAKPGPEKYDHSAKYRKDKQLKALRQLARKEGLGKKDRQLVEQAIDVRIQILKATY